MEIKIVTLPEKKEDLEVSEKVKKIVEDRNLVISKRFKTEPKDVTVNLNFSVDGLRSKVNATGDNRLGIFSGYVDYTDEIEIAHPIGIEPIFGENLYKQISIMVDYTLTKMYLCKIYYPNPDNFMRYYMYFSDAFARITSGNFQKDSIDFLIRQYSDFKKYTKDEEIKMVLLVMLEKSGIDFIYDNLNVMFEDCNIKKSLMKIYKKDFKELVGIYQKELIETDKKLKQVR